MGGCRCSYKSCRNTTKTTQSVHFFHYPVKQKERCKAWINRACKPNFFDLDEFQLRNKVICEVHFADNCFLNSEKKRLLPQAIPTLDGECPMSPKMDDIQILPANEDGTVFLLETCPSFKVKKEVKSYILNDDALFPIGKNHDLFPCIKQEPELIEVDQNDYILSDNNHFPDHQDTPIRKYQSPAMNKVNKTNFEFLNCDLISRNPPPDNNITNAALESMICKTVESKYLHKLEQHTKDLNQIKRALKMSNRKNKVTKTSVLRFLKLRLPPSLYGLVNLSLNDGYELNEEDENFFKSLHDSSSKTYQFLSEECSWRMPIIEIHEGEPEAIEES